jgi:hypothetical protein
VKCETLVRNIVDLYVNPTTPCMHHRLLFHVDWALPLAVMRSFLANSFPSIFLVSSFAIADTVEFVANTLETIPWCIYLLKHKFFVLVY